jgi:hypothetical protein
MIELIIPTEFETCFTQCIVTVLGTRMTFGYPQRVPQFYRLSHRLLRLFIGQAKVFWVT